MLFSNSDLRKMIIPLFFEQFLLLLVGLADTFMVSFAGDAAVSGVSLVNMFVTVFIYLFTALASGGAVVVSQYIGSRERDKANLSAGQLLMLSAILSLGLMAAVLLWNRGLLRFLFGRVEPDVMDACVIYQRIMAYSFPALAVYNAGAALCRSMGRTDLTLYISIVANVINVIGNAIGIFILRAGVAGVAWPTLAARTFSAVVVTLICMDRGRMVFYRLRDVFHWSWDMTRRIFGVAVPNGIDAGMFQLTKVALSSITALFGTAQIAANGIAQAFWSIASMMVTVMGPVFVTVIGRCMGAGDIAQAEHYFRKLNRITLVLSVAWNILVFACVPFIMRGYPLSAEIIRMVILLVLLHNIFSSIVFPYAGALPNGLRAAGDVRFTMYISLFATVCVRLVLSFILGEWLNMGVFGVAWAMCADWCVRALFCVHRWRSGKWKQFKVI